MNIVDVLRNKVAEKTARKEHHVARSPLANVLITSGRCPIGLKNVGVFVLN